MSALTKLPHVGDDPRFKAMREILMASDTNRFLAQRREPRSFQPRFALAVAAEVVLQSGYCRIHLFPIPLNPLAMALLPHDSRKWRKWRPRKSCTMNDGKWGFPEMGVPQKLNCNLGGGNPIKMDDD